MTDHQNQKYLPMNTEHDTHHLGSKMLKKIVST